MDRPLLFLIAGSSLLIFMGAVHVVLTLLDTPRCRVFAPRDDTLRERMATVPVRLTGKMAVWKAYVGFNLSHGLGILFVGSLSLLTAILDPDSTAAGAPLIPVAILYCLAEVLLAVRYWFLLPVAGFALSGGCFVAAYLAGRF